MFQMIVRWISLDFFRVGYFGTIQRVHIYIVYWGCSCSLLVMFLLRQHDFLGGVKGSGQVEMVPTSPPDLPKPSRTLRKSQKPQFQNPKFQIKIREIFLIFLIHPFFGPPPGGDGPASCLYHLQMSRRCSKRNSGSGLPDSHPLARQICMKLPLKEKGSGPAAPGGPQKKVNKEINKEI